MYEAFQLNSCVQYPRVPLCGNLITYARAIPLPRSTQETPQDGFKCTPQFKQPYTHPHCMSEHMRFSSFHGYSTLSYPYVVTLLFTLGLPRYLGGPPRGTLGTTQGSFKCSQWFSSNIHIPHCMSERFLGHFLCVVPQVLCGNLNIYARATSLPRGMLGTTQSDYKCSQWFSSHIHTPYCMYELRNFQLVSWIQYPRVTLLFTLRLPHYLGVSKRPPKVISNVPSS